MVSVGKLLRVENFFGLGEGIYLGEGDYNKLLQQETLRFNNFTQQYKMGVYNREDEDFLLKMSSVHNDRLNSLKKKGTRLQTKDEINKNNEKIKEVFDNMVASLEMINIIYQQWVDYLERKKSAFNPEISMSTIEDFEARKQDVLGKIRKTMEKIEKIKKMKEEFMFSNELTSGFTVTNENGGSRGKTRLSKARARARAKSMMRKKMRSTSKGKRRRRSRYTRKNN